MNVINRLMDTTTAEKKKLGRQLPRLGLGMGPGLNPHRVLGPGFGIPLGPAFHHSNLWNEQPSMRNTMAKQKEFDPRKKEGIMQGYSDMKKETQGRALYLNQDVRKQ
mgnify:CR=1 FL=1